MISPSLTLIVDVASRTPIIGWSLLSILIFSITFSIVCSITICTVPSAPIRGVTDSLIPISRYSIELREFRVLLIPDVVEPVMIGCERLTLIMPSSLWLTTIRGADKTLVSLSVLVGVMSVVI